jgi:ABC-type nitrate/sulfonate/bicarbonate transport system permease component
MRMLVFFVVALVGLVVAYGFALGGAVATLIFLFILANGVLDRWAQPLLQRLRS